MKTYISRELTRATKLFVVFCLTISGQIAPARSFSTNWPSTAAASAFHLRDQRFATNGASPPFANLTYQVEDGHLTVKDGKAEHHFDTIKPRSWAVDQDLLIVVDVDDVVHAIDVNLLNGVVFRGPVPVFKLIELKNVPAEGVKLESRFVDQRTWTALRPFSSTDGVRPFDRPADYRWQAGDFTLLDRTDGKARVLAELDRSVIMSQVRAFETILSHWADMLHPEGSDRDAPEYGADLPYPAALAIKSLKKDTLERLVPNAPYFLERAHAQRDEFKTIGDVPVEVPTLDNVGSRLGPVALTTIAAATLGGAALIAAAQHYGFDLDFARMVHQTFAKLDFLIPAVLTDTVYRHTLFKAAFWLSIIPPILWGVSFIADKTIWHLGDARLTWTQAGMRIFSTLNVPFWRVIPALFRQPHVIKAASLGLNPFRVVQPESATGRRAGIDRPTSTGVINPFLVGADRADAKARVAAVLDAKEEQITDRRTLAKWLALTVVAEEQKIDPALIEAVAEQDDAGTPLGGRIDPALNQRRRELAARLASELLGRLSRRDDYDVSTLSEENLRRELVRARKAARELADRDRFGELIGRGRYEWNRLVTGGLRGLYTFARAENEFWGTARPTKFVANSGWRTFLNDYYIGMIYTMLIGPRADLSKPGDLVAREGEFASANPGARYDIGDTARWYSINHSAILSFIWQGKKEPDKDATYQKRETEQFRPKYQAPGAYEEFIRYARDFVNPSSGRYGEVLLERLVVSIYMWQTSMLLTTGARIVFASADLTSSLENFAYHFIWGHIGVGLIWDWIHSTNKRMEKHYERNRERTEHAVNGLGASLRLDDSKGVDRGVRDLLNLYAERPDRQNARTRKQIARIDAYGEEGIPLEDARELLANAIARPPLPGKNPLWLVRTMAGVGVGIGTYLGLRMSVPTFRPDVDWNYLLGTSLVDATAIYLATFVGVKLWRGHQARRAPVCEADLLAPGINLNPLRE